jgi:hypothetical protein
MKGSNDLKGIIFTSIQAKGKKRDFRTSESTRVSIFPPLTPAYKSIYLLDNVLFTNGMIE